MKALIAGAGISGLATGIALRQIGFDVEIYERSSRLREIGAGLMIWPNGARSLEALGVKIDALRVQRLSICTWRGHHLNDYPLQSVSKRFGFDPSFVHRAELQAALAMRFGSDGLFLGAEVNGFEQDGARVQVILHDGRAADGDLLVGADGLRSVVRRELLADGDPVYLGSTIWRGVVQREERLRIQPECGINWIGRGAEFLAFHLKGDRIYWAGVTKEPRGERAGPGGHKRDLIERFGSWAKPVPELIAATDSAAILRNDMYDRPRAPHWSGGRVTLVGDSAHPMTPNAGQGACQALEDAVALGNSLKEASNPTEAFSLYERARLRRANRVVAMSRQATRAVQIENQVLCALRDTVAYRIAQLVFLRTLDAILAPEPADIG
jgi:2-polyprenyl-6-methoxyphenol hydroxylase-like FAD-dependent oxidoreductase